MAKKPNRNNRSPQTPHIMQPMWKKLAPVANEFVVSKLMKEIKTRDANLAEKDKKIAELQMEKEKIERQLLDKEKATIEQEPLGVLPVRSQISVTSNNSGENSEVAPEFPAPHPPNVHEIIDENIDTVEEIVVSTASSVDSARSPGPQQQEIRQTIVEPSTSINEDTAFLPASSIDTSIRSQGPQQHEIRQTTVEPSTSRIEDAAVFSPSTSEISRSTSDVGLNSNRKRSSDHLERTEENTVNKRQYQLGSSKRHESQGDQSSLEISVEVSQPSGMADESSRIVPAPTMSEMDDPMSMTSISEDSSIYSSSPTRHEPDSTWVFPSTLSDYSSLSSLNETRLEKVELRKRPDKPKPQIPANRLRSMAVVNSALKIMNEQIAAAPGSQLECCIADVSKVTIRKKNLPEKRKKPEFLIAELVESQQSRSKSRSKSESSSGNDSSSSSSEAASSSGNKDISANDSGSKSVKEACFKVTNNRLNTIWKQQLLSQSNPICGETFSEFKRPKNKGKKGKKHASKSLGSLASSMNSTKNPVNDTNQISTSQSTVLDITSSGINVSVGSGFGSLRWPSIMMNNSDANLSIDQIQINSLENTLEEQEHFPAELQPQSIETIENCQPEQQTTKSPEADNSSLEPLASSMISMNTPVDIVGTSKSTVLNITSGEINLSFGSSFGSLRWPSIMMNNSDANLSIDQIEINNLANILSEEQDKLPAELQQQPENCHPEQSTKSLEVDKVPEQPEQPANSEMEEFWESYPVVNGDNFKKVMKALTAYREAKSTLEKLGSETKEVIGILNESFDPSSDLSPDDIVQKLEDCIEKNLDEELLTLVKDRSFEEINPNNPGPSKSLPSEEQLPYLLKFDGTTANIIPQLGVPEIVKPSSNEKANALKSVEEKEIHPLSPKLNQPPIALKRLAKKSSTSKPRLSKSPPLREKLPFDESATATAKRIPETEVPEIIDLSSDEEEEEEGKENFPNQVDYINRSRGGLPLPVKNKSPELLVKKSSTYRFTYRKPQPGAVQRIL